MEILGRTQMQVVYCLNPSTNSKRTGDLDVNLLRRQVCFFHDDDNFFLMFRKCLHIYVIISFFI